MDKYSITKQIVNILFFNSVKHCSKLEMIMIYMFQYLASFQEKSFKKNQNVVIKVKNLLLLLLLFFLSL